MMKLTDMVLYPQKAFCIMYEGTAVELAPASAMGGYRLLRGYRSRLKPVIPACGIYAAFGNGIESEIELVGETDNTQVWLGVRISEEAQTQCWRVRDSCQEQMFHRC